MPGVQELLVKRKLMLDKYFTLEDQEFEVKEDGVKKRLTLFARQIAVRLFVYSHSPLSLSSAKYIYLSIRTAN